MRIKLIMPRMTLRPMDSEFKRMMSPPLSLLVLAALTPEHHEVEIADENAGPLDLGDCPDLVGMTVNVDTSKRAADIALDYRRRGIPVIVGGIHASANPDQALEYADSVCIGEAEELWEDILRDHSRGELGRLYQAGSAAEPSKIPSPKRGLVDGSRYLYTNIVVTSRGCPFKCAFCYNSCEYIQRGVRNRPIDHVIEEIGGLGTKQVMFIDDNFIGNMAWTREFLQRIKPLGLRWHAAVSANIGEHLGLLDLMAETGCRSLFIGLETIDGAALRGVGKLQNRTEKYDRLVAEIHSRGIMINASLVFGFDDHGPDVFGQTLDWLVKNKIETMTAHILTPYPGTKLHSNWEREGRIVDRTPEHYNTSHAVFVPQGMTREELREGYLWMYKEFYSLRTILRRLPDDPRRRMAFLLFNLIYRRFGRFASRLAANGFMSRVGTLARRLSYGIQ